MLIAKGPGHTNTDNLSLIGKQHADEHRRRCQCYWVLLCALLLHQMSWGFRELADVRSVGCHILS